MISELPNQTVIRYPWKYRVISSIAVSAFVASAILYKEHSLTLALLGLILAPFGLLVKRRRIVISEGEVTYRPSFGESQSARFDQVASVRQKTVGVVSAGGIYPTDGVELVHANGMPLLQIPLDLFGDIEREQVFNKIVSAWKRCQEAEGLRRIV
jgi:hypothetical protein